MMPHLWYKSHLTEANSVRKLPRIVKCYADEVYEKGNLSISPPNQDINLAKMPPPMTFTVQIDMHCGSP